jgi:hypothetical protein
MYPYFLPANSCPRWVLVMAVSMLSKSNQIIAVGRMPDPEPGVTILTAAPIPPEDVKVMHLIPLE